MSTKIRLKRMGTKRRPYYRIIAIDSRRAVGGPVLDNLGHYAAIEKPAKVIVNEEKAFKWLDEGAVPSDTVATLFTQIGLTKKYLAQKAGQDVSEMTLDTTITERLKKRKSKKKTD
ncbi:MAG: 30S ribosomal protein S16 [candidate division Zixibacteria bacterium]|nr:30S ribosomal protein S16 [candidate division Zixibacteria bacterium]